MDKYEYTIKTDKIKKLVEKRDFKTAAKIADTIDWDRVNNTKMLIAISQIYEKLRRYRDAKEILVLAYELAPASRRTVYRLTELAAKSGSFIEAEEFYREFLEMSPKDLSRYILRYQISSGKGEPLDKQITILEAYCHNEKDERWSLELAKLYHQSGKCDECVRACDDIILWFAIGPYVEKAMELKQIYKPLSPAQQEKLQNKKKYEKKIMEIERQFAKAEGDSGYSADTEAMDSSSEASDDNDASPFGDKVSDITSNGVNQMEADDMLPEPKSDDDYSDQDKTQEVILPRIPDETKELTDLKEAIRQYKELQWKIEQQKVEDDNHTDSAQSEEAKASRDAQMRSEAVFAQESTNQLSGFEEELKQLGSRLKKIFDESAEHKQKDTQYDDLYAELDIDLQIPPIDTTSISSSEDSQMEAEAEAEETTQIEAEETTQIEAEVEAEEASQMEAETEAVEILQMEAETEAVEASQMDATAESEEASQTEAKSEAEEVSKMDTQAAEEALLDDTDEIDEFDSSEFKQIILSSQEEDSVEASDNDGNEIKLQENLIEESDLMENSVEDEMTQENSIDKIDSYKLNCILLEVNDSEQALTEALAVIKSIHDENQMISGQTAAIQAEKMNKKSFAGTITRLNGRNLAIVNAGRLKDELLNELPPLTKEIKEPSVIVMADKYEGITSILTRCPAMKFITVVKNASKEFAESIYLAKPEYSEERNYSPSSQKKAGFHLDTSNVSESVRTTASETFATPEVASAKLDDEDGIINSSRVKETNSITKQDMLDNKAEESEQQGCNRPEAALPVEAGEAAQSTEVEKAVLFTEAEEANLSAQMAEYTSAAQLTAAVEIGQPVSKAGIAQSTDKTVTVQSKVETEDSSLAEKLETAQPADSTEAAYSIKSEEVDQSTDSVQEKESTMAAEASRHETDADLSRALEQELKNTLTQEAVGIKGNKNSSILSSGERDAVENVYQAFQAEVDKGDFNKQQLSVKAYVDAVIKYAKELDCIVDDMGILAIYALTEKLLENGEILDLEKARKTTDNAIYRAERRSIKGVFTGKYDKNGYLILKENHFRE